MHDVLSCWERRAILYALTERDGPASPAALARSLVGWRRGNETPAPATDDTVERIRRDLLHSHVLRMERLGVLAYEPRTDEVRLVEDVTVAVSAPWRDRTDAPPADTEAND